MDDVIRGRGYERAKADDGTLTFRPIISVQHIINEIEQAINEIGYPDGDLSACVRLNKLVDDLKRVLAVTT